MSDLVANHKDLFSSVVAHLWVASLTRCWGGGGILIDKFTFIVIAHD